MFTSYGAARGGAVLLALLVCAASAALPAPPATGRCTALLESHYSNDSLPATLGALCNGDQDPALEWLADVSISHHPGKAQLRDLRQLAGDLDAPLGQPPLANAALAKALTDIEQEKAAPPSWFDQLRAWLLDYTGDHSASDLAWLTRWLDRLADYSALFQTALRIAVVLMLVAVLYVVLREFEAGGLRLAPFERRRRPIALDPSTPDAALRFSWSEVLATAPRARPGALLRWLLFALRGHELLPADDSLTNREHLAVLAHHRSPLAQPFAALLDDLEPSIYGRRSVIDSSELDALAARVLQLVADADRA